MPPNVNVYNIDNGEKDKYSNIEFICNVGDFNYDVIYKAFSHMIGTLNIFFVLN